MSPTCIAAQHEADSRGGRRRRRRRPLGAVSCLFCLVLGCSEGSDEPTESTVDYVYPEPDWVTERPEDHGFSAEGLEAMAQVAESYNSNCLLVTHAGVIIGEWYWHDYDPEFDQPNVYSVTKSITSALVGIAADQGLLDIDAPVGFPEWEGTEAEAITIRNLISNDSGRPWNPMVEGLFQSASDPTQYAIDLPQRYPVGTYWEYNDPAIQTLQRALETATGEDVADYAQEHLFGRLHMSVTMGHDTAGNVQTYQGVSASCRDLARFGYLYLRGGRWAGGEQVVPEAWVEASIEPSTELNSGYGYMWWLNRPGHWVLSSAGEDWPRWEGDGRPDPDAPEDRYTASGAQGQFIVVQPSTETVWVRLGISPNDPRGTATLHDLWVAFAAAQLP